jgi:hypothetical protein
MVIYVVETTRRGSVVPGAETHVADVLHILIHVPLLQCSELQMHHCVERDASYLGSILSLFRRNIEVIRRVEIRRINVVVVLLQVLNKLSKGIDVVGTFVV